MINVHFVDSFREPKTWPAYQHDYGQKLRILGLNLPSVVEAHFSTDEKGMSILRMGTCEDGVAIVPIPDECLEHSGRFYCYVYDRAAQSGRTVYKIMVEVEKRPELPQETTEPTEQDVSYFEEVLAQMQGIYEQAKAAKNEGFKVTFTSREISVDPATYAITYETTCDKTLAEIWEAFSSGQYVYAEHKILRPVDPNHEYSEGAVIENGSEVYTYYYNVVDGNPDIFTFHRNRVYCTHPEDPTISHSWNALVEEVEIRLDRTTHQEVCEYTDCIGATMPTFGEVSEIFEVLFTDPGSSNSLSHEVTCNRTLAEVLGALKSGKHVYAKVVNGTNSDATYLSMLDGYNEAGSNANDCVVFGTYFFEYPQGSGYQLTPYRYKLYAQTAVAESWTADLASQTALERLERNMAGFKVTITTENGNDARTSADVSFSQIKAAVDAGRRAYAEVKYYTDVQDESTYSHSIVLPFLYESTEEGNEEIAFGYCWAYDYGQNYDYLEGQAFFASFYSGNGMSFGKKTGMRFAKKSALEALSQQVSGLSQQVSGLSAHGVGEDCHGKTMEYYDEVAHQTETMTGGTGAECFNDYEDNKPIGNYSHAEGCSTEAWGTYSHAEGYYTRAGDQSTFGECDGAHAEGGYTIAKKEYSHAEGYGTIAGSREQHVQGHYNIEDEYQTYADIIGNGTGDNARSNAQTSSWSGVLWTASDVRCGGDDMDDQNAISLAALAQRIAAIEQAIS